MRSVVFHSYYFAPGSEGSLSIVITMVMVDVDGSCQILADSQPKSTGLV